MAVNSTQIIGIGASGGAKVGTTALIGATGLTGVAAAAVSFGIALPITLGLALLAAHDKRVQAAKTDVGAMIQAIATFEADLNAIFNALNSGQLTPNQGIQALDTLDAAYWKFVQPYVMAMAGPCLPLKLRSDNDSYCWSSTKCDKKCTSACCDGCNVVDAVVQRAIEIVASGKPGKIHFCQTFDSGSYNGVQYKGHPAYDIQYTPAPIASSVEGQISNLLGIGSPGYGESGLVQAIGQGNMQVLLLAGLGLVGFLFLMTFVGGQK